MKSVTNLHIETFFELAWSRINRACYEIDERFATGSDRFETKHTFSETIVLLYNEQQPKKTRWIGFIREIDGQAKIINADETLPLLTSQMERKQTGIELEIVQPWCVLPTRDRLCHRAQKKNLLVVRLKRMTYFRRFEGGS